MLVKLCAYDLDMRIKLLRVDTHKRITFIYINNDQRYVNDSYNIIDCVDGC